MSGQTPNKIHEYITFPLSLSQGLLLSDLAASKATIRKIIGYGRADFAINKNHFDQSKLKRQAVYLFYQGHLPVAFMFEANQAISIGDLVLYSETKGFSTDGKEFMPDSIEIQSLSDFINKNGYAEVWDWCKLSFYVPNDQIGAYYKVYSEVIHEQKKFTAKYGKDATLSVKYEMLADFFKEPPANDLLTAYFALRSLQGKKQTYIKTFKKTILLRMTGCKSYEVLNEVSTPELNERINQLEKRKTFEKLLSRLEFRGLITGRFKLPNTNFFLLSTSIDTIEIARLFAKEKYNADQERVQKEALELFTKLTSKE